MALDFFLWLRRLSAPPKPPGSGTPSHRNAKNLDHTSAKLSRALPGALPPRALYMIFGPAVPQKDPLDKLLKGIPPVELTCSWIFAFCRDLRLELPWKKCTPASKTSDHQLQEDAKHSWHEVPTRTTQVAATMHRKRCTRTTQDSSVFVVLRECPCQVLRECPCQWVT